MFTTTAKGSVQSGGFWDLFEHSVRGTVIEKEWICNRYFGVSRSLPRGSENGEFGFFAECPKSCRDSARSRGLN